MHVLFDPQGRPFLLGSQMRWELEPNAFLAKVSIVSGRTNSPRTWRSYGIVPPLSSFAGLCAGVSFIEAGEGDVMDHILGVLTEWRGCDDAQVLAMTKRGASGVRSINATLHAMASPTKPKLEGWGFAEGDPIIYLVNDYQKELWNGSLGRIECILSSNGRRSLLCCLDGARKEIPAATYPIQLRLRTHLPNYVVAVPLTPYTLSQSDPSSS